MNLTTKLAGALLAAGLIAGSGAAMTTAATAAPAQHTATAHACTHTSSGSCIRGGELCPQASYNHSGYDAKGRRYVCKGSKAHPHWEKP